MALRVTFRDQQVGKRYRISMVKHGARFRKAEVAAAHDALDKMLELGRANIAGAGNFGSRWTEGLTGKVVASKGQDITIQVSHDVPYFTVFQFGKRILGKPLLWIPLSFSDARGRRARDYPAPLFRVDRAGSKAPLLLSTADKQPKYFGKESVTIPKKFRVLEIIRGVAAEIRRFYTIRLAGK